MTWTFDMDAGKTEPRVIAVGRYEGADTVLPSRWLPPQKDRPLGRWEGFTAGNPPYAFMAWPEPPGLVPAPGCGAAVDAMLAAGWTKEQIIAEGLATP